MIEKPICVYTVFVESYEIRAEGLDLKGVTWHPSGFTFDLADDEAELGDFPRYLVISILANPGDYEIVVRHTDLGWEHRGSFTIDPNQGESTTYVVPSPIRFAVLSEKLLNQYSISLNGEHVGYAYLYWTPVRV